MVDLPGLSATPELKFQLLFGGKIYIALGITRGHPSENTRNQHSCTVSNSPIALYCERLIFELFSLVFLLLRRGNSQQGRLAPPKEVLTLYSFPSAMG